MEFRLLEYFLAVAREQNITAAAESLHISQPALSTQLKAMEMELGKQLLIRGVKAVSYTHLAPQTLRFPRMFPLEWKGGLPDRLLLVHYSHNLQATVPRKKR